MKKQVYKKINIFGGFVILMFLLFFSPLSATGVTWEDGRMTIDYSTEVYYEEVYGNVDRSNLDIDNDNYPHKHHDNWHYNESLRFRLDQKISEKIALEFYAYVRNTTDKQVMDHRWYLLQIYLRLYGDDFELAVGDVSDYYTKYSFNNTFLGVKAWYKPSPSFKFMALVGQNREPWDDEYRHTFAGGRVEYTPKSEYLFGMTYLHDEVTWLYWRVRENPDYNSNVKDYSNDVLSADFRVKLLDRTLLIKGEGAWSYYHEDRRDYLADAYDGWAAYVEVDYRPIRSLKLSFDYEYVEPDFVTVMGTAARDRETFKGEVRYTPSSSFKLWAEYKYTRNLLDLDSDATYRTYRSYYETGAEYSPFYESEGYFQRLKLKLQGKLYSSYSNDSPRSVDKDTYDFSFIVSNRYDTMYYSLEYRLRYTNDHTTDGTDRMSNSFAAKWGYTFDALNLGWDISCGYKFEYKTTWEYGPYQLYEDYAHILDAGLGVTYEPTKTTLTLSYLGIISYLQGSDRYDTMRNSTKAALEQVLYENDTITSTLVLSFENMDYHTDDTGNSYGENIYKATLNLRF